MANLCYCVSLNIRSHIACLVFCVEKQRQCYRLDKSSSVHGPSPPPVHYRGSPCMRSRSQSGGGALCIEWEGGNRQLNWEAVTLDLTKETSITVCTDRGINPPAARLYFVLQLQKQLGKEVFSAQC